MPNWLKKAFSKKDEREPPPPSATTPSTSGTQSSSTSQRQTQSRYPSQRSSAPSSSSRIYGGVVNSGVGAPLPRPQSRTRISTHDLTMAAVTLGVAPPPSPNPVHYSPSTSTNNASSSSVPLRPDIQQQQIDSDLAMAYSLAQQEQQSGRSSGGAGQLSQQRMQAMPPPLPPQRPLPPLQQPPQHPGLPPGSSPFGEAVSLPPPAAGTRPDLAMAAALAESQFAARQADELARTTEAVYQAAVNKALEASLQTVNYDDVLRDIKLWIIDLAASTDDVHAALDSIVQQRREVAVRLEKALDADDERKIRKLGWMAEQLPIAEEKLRILADKMMPIGVAVLELQDLRDHVGSASPPLDEVGRQRDIIMIRLFTAMEQAGLRLPSRSSDYNGEISSDGAGPSTSRPASPEMQAPADLRDLVAALIDEAQKLPKMPRRKSSGSIATSANTTTPSLADPSEVRELPLTPVSGSGGGGGGSDGGGGNGEGTTPQSTTPAAAAAVTDDVAASEEEMEQQPSAPHQESSSDALPLPTPIGNDLISFAEEEEEEQEDNNDKSEPAAPLQTHRLEIFEDDEEQGKQQEEQQQQEEPEQPQQTPSIAVVLPPPTPVVDCSIFQEQQEKNEIYGTPTTIPENEVEKGEGVTEMEKEMVNNGVKKLPLWRRLSNRNQTPPAPPPASQPSASSPGSGGVSSSSSIPSATSTPSSVSQQRRNKSSYTTPVPFQLSSSRWKAKGASEAPTAANTLRRIPALISLNYEMEKDAGVVADAVGWTAGRGNSNNIEIRPTAAVPPPVALHSNYSFETPEEMVAFVKNQSEGSFPSLVPSRFDASSRWSVMCAAAGAHEALTMAVQELSSWEIKATPGAATAAASVVAESHRLVDYLARVSSILSTVGQPHDPLRHALVKHHLPWDETLTTQVRWAAQHAGVAVMSQAIEASEEAERTKGPWQRQAVLQPLGHGVKAAFSVHQLAGGFGSEVASVCDYLVERTVHYARMIDPKWFRGHKVVAS